MNLVAYHNIIASPADVQRAFAELDRDDYPDPVYAYIFDYHTETQTPVIDVIAWCCDINHAKAGTDEYDNLSDDAFVIYSDDGVWYID